MDGSIFWAVFDRDGSRIGQPSVGPDQNWPGPPLKNAHKAASGASKSPQASGKFINRLAIFNVHHKPDPDGVGI